MALRVGVWSRRSWRGEVVFPSWWTDGSQRAWVLAVTGWSGEVPEGFLVPRPPAVPRIVRRDRSADPLWLRQLDEQRRAFVASLVAIPTCRLPGSSMLV